MVSKVCSRSQGQPLPGVRNAAMMARRRSMSREGVIHVVSVDRSASIGALREARRQVGLSGLMPGRAAQAAAIAVLSLNVMSRALSAGPEATSDPPELPIWDSHKVYYGTAARLSGHPPVQA